MMGGNTFEKQAAEKKAAPAELTGAVRKQAAPAVTSNEKKVMINKCATEVFEFTVDPSSTPLWISKIEAEEVDTFPVAVGTVYCNVDKEGVHNSYKVTAFKKDKLFELKALDSSYHVRYTYEPLGQKSTMLTYYEWVDSGELKDPFELSTLQRLKDVLESC